MMILYWTMTIMVMLAYIYTPCVCLYGAVRLCIERTTDKVVCSPFFGLKKVSLEYGLIIWTMQITYLAVIINDFVSMYLKGTHPYFFDILKF